MMRTAILALILHGASLATAAPSPVLAAARNGVIPAIRKGGVIFLPRQLGVRSWRRGM